MARIQQTRAGVKYSCKKDPLFGVSSDLRRLQAKERKESKQSLGRRKWNHNAVVIDSL